MAIKEYPKIVTTADKKRVTVANKVEEMRVLGQVESPKLENDPKPKGKPKTDWSN